MYKYWKCTSSWSQSGGVLASLAPESLVLSTPLDEKKEIILARSVENFSRMYMNESIDHAFNSIDFFFFADS